MKINETVQAVHETAKSKGWHEVERSPLEIHMLVVSEVAEATECARKRTEPVWIGLDGKPEGEAVELADAVIRIMDYFGAKGWDLEKVIQEKMEFNATRPHRHGGKRY